MDQSGVPKPAERAQSSIRSFFQPRVPSYTTPPPPPSTSYAPRPTAQLLSTITSTPIPNAPSVSKPAPSTTASLSPSLCRLPSQGSISRIHPKHVQPLKRINALLLPINYPDSFYHKIIDQQTSPNFSRVIIWQDTPSKAEFGSVTESKVVGGIVCRLDRDHVSGTSSIYIQSLALLSPYRAYGLATAALDSIIESLVSMPSTELPITSLYAHVWTENTDGLEWYKARGFTQEPSAINGYYSRLNPSSAWILRRSVVPSDHLYHSTQKRNNSAALHNSPMPPQPFSTLQASTSTPELGVLPSPSTSLKTLQLRPEHTSRASSFQNSGPGHEWNDLPEDILKPSSSSSSLQRTLSSHLMPPNGGSATSSRSSSKSRTGDKGKKKRQYPAAAFGPGTTAQG